MSRGNGYLLCRIELVLAIEQFFIGAVDNRWLFLLFTRFTPMQMDNKVTEGLRTKQRCTVWAVAQSLDIFLVSAWPWLCQASHKCSWMKFPGLAGTQMEDHVQIWSNVKEQANTELQMQASWKIMFQPCCDCREGMRRLPAHTAMEETGIQSQV